MSSFDANTADPKLVLQALSKYAKAIQSKGFDSRVFYYNRTRVFLSLTAKKSNANTRTTATILLFVVASMLRLIKGIFSYNGNRSFLIVDTRETYGKVFRGEACYDNVILSNLYSRINWKKVRLLDRFNVPFDLQLFGSNWLSFVKNHFNRPRLYEELVLFKYLVTHPFSWKKTSTFCNRYFSELAHHSFDDELLQSIHTQFLKYRKSSRFFLWKEEAYQWFFSSSYYQRILLLDEYSPNQRSILHGAIQSNVECLALQHGGMHDLHPGYVYGEEDKKLNVFPSQFLTWGESFANFLKKNNWPISISSVGHLRTDIIPQLEREKSSEKRVMFASQPHKDEKYTEDVAKLVFQTFSSMNEKIQVYLRPHPLEKNVNKYQGWADQVGLANLRIDSQTDLYVALSNTDVVITSFSTVGQEAIYFDIPLITVDILDRDIAHYVEEGVAQNVTSPEELNAILKEKLNKPDVDSNAVQIYISNYAYKIDGRVSERIIEKLLSE